MVASSARCREVMVITINQFLLNSSTQQDEQEMAAKRR
jgi:hypothetical protein